MASKRDAALEAMIEEATVDAYNDDEQLSGLFVMIEEHLVVPFTTIVLGVEVTVKKPEETGIPEPGYDDAALRSAPSGRPARDGLQRPAAPAVRPEHALR